MSKKIKLSLNPNAESILIAEKNQSKPTQNLANP